MDAQPLAGRVIVITGAGGGLGRSHALVCGSLGARIVVNDAEARLAQETVARLHERGTEAVAIAARVDDEAGAEMIRDGAVQRFGRVDALVNNAGFLRDHSLVKLSTEEWDAVVGVHLRGSFLVTRALWPLLRDSGSGRVVMTTSHAGLVGNHGQSNYAAAKMGVVGLANTLAIEGARSGIGVNVVAPLARTRQSEGVWSEDVLQRLDPGYVSMLIAHLCAEACTVSAMLFGVAGGEYVRHELCDAGRAVFDHVPRYDELREHWHELTDSTPRAPTTYASVEAMLRGERPRD